MGKAILLSDKRLEGKSAYYATFGSGHAHPDGYFKIWALSKQDAMALMFRFFGNKFGVVYDDAGAAGIHKYHLNKIREVVFGI